MNARELMGRMVETHVNGRLVRGRVVNVFANGKAHIRPVYSRNGNTCTPLTGKQRLASVRVDRCEVV